MEFSVELILSNMARLYDSTKISLDNMEEVIRMIRQMLGSGFTISDSMVSNLDRNLDHSIEVLFELNNLLLKLNSLIPKLQREECDYEDLDEIVRDLLDVQGKLGINIEESRKIANTTQQCVESIDLMNSLRGSDF